MENYICNYCHKSFTRKYTMDRHIKSNCKSSENPINTDNNIFSMVKDIKSELNNLSKENELLKEKIKVLEETPTSVTNNITNNTQNIIYFNNSFDVFELMEKKLSREESIKFYLHDLPITKDITSVIDQIIDQCGESCPITLNNDGDIQIYIDKNRTEPLIDKLGNYLNKHTAYLCVKASHKAYGISAQNAPNIDQYPEEYNSFMINGFGNHPSLEKWDNDKKLINGLGQKTSSSLLKHVKLKIKCKDKSK